LQRGVDELYESSAGDASSEARACDPLAPILKQLPDRGGEDRPAKVGDRNGPRGLYGVGALRKELTTSGKILAASVLPPKSVPAGAMPFHGNTLE
jgi:hypothetical protein